MRKTTQSKKSKTGREHGARPAASRPNVRSARPARPAAKSAKSAPIANGKTTSREKKSATTEKATTKTLKIDKSAMKQVAASARPGAAHTAGKSTAAAAKRAPDRASSAVAASGRNGAAKTVQRSETKISAAPKTLVEAATDSARNGHQNGAEQTQPRKTGRAMAKSTQPEPATIALSPDYRPSDKEPFMNVRQRSYFRAKLLQLKDDIIKQNRETLHTLHEDTSQHSDLADRATSEAERALELRTRDRQRKLVNKIDAAITRIDDGSYGYCEETGEPISLRRLDARPIATLSLEAQERHERRERVYRED